MAVVAGPVALAAAGADDDAPDAATFTCVTGPLSPGLPIRTLTLTLVGDDCTDVTGAGAVVRAAGAIPPAVSTETVVVSGAAGSVCGVDMAPGAVSAAGAAAGTAADVSSAGVGSPVACASPPSASATALSTAALASSTSTAPGSTDGTAAGDWGTEAKPSSARASAGRVAAAAPTSVAATTHVARRTVVIGAMHRHLCNHVDVFIHHFSLPLSRHRSADALFWSGQGAVDRVAYRGKHGEGQRQRSTAALLSAYHRRGDRAARTRVIEQNLPLVHSLARRFSRPSEPLDDLVQAGAVGLIKAVDGFREDRGRDLGAYAVPTIVGELRRHVRERVSASSIAVLQEEALEREHSLRRRRVRPGSSCAPRSTCSLPANVASSRSASTATGASSASLRRWDFRRCRCRGCSRHRSRRCATGSRQPDAGMRRIVRTASSPYTRRLVSAQPSASDVHEVSRTKTPSAEWTPPPSHAPGPPRGAGAGGGARGDEPQRLHHRPTRGVGRTARPRTGRRPERDFRRSTLRRLLIANVATVALASVAALAILLVAWLG